LGKGLHRNTIQYQPLSLSVVTITGSDPWALAEKAYIIMQRVDGGRPEEEN